MDNVFHPFKKRPKLDAIIEKYAGKQGRLLSIMEEIQNTKPGRYLSREDLAYVAENTNIPLSRIYSVATFYSFFNLRPQGEHTIVICRGTACHTRGSKNLLDSIKKILDIKEEKVQEGGKIFLTTKDKRFTVKTVACFGQCAMAPVVDIDGEIYGNVNEQMLRKLIEGVIKKSKKK